MSRGVITLSQMTTQVRPGWAERMAGHEHRPSGQAPRRAADRRLRRPWVPLTAGLMSMVTGLGYLIEGTAPGLTERRLRGLMYLGTVTRTADLIIGLLLLMVSHGLRRRKRRAWEAALALLVGGIMVHLGLDHIAHFIDPDRSWLSLVSPPGPVKLLPSLFLVGALLWFRGEFYAEGDTRSRFRALWVLCYLVAADVLIGLAYLSVGHAMRPGYSLLQQTHTAVASLAGFSGPVIFTSATQADRFAFVTGGLGLFTLVVAAFLFLRPARRPCQQQTADAVGIRRLLEVHGERDSLGYFALRGDKNVIWSASGKACIGYRVLSGVMLASGDPIGDPEAWPGAIHAFLDEAARHAWVPAVLGCGELGAEIWCREGQLTALELGDEAVVYAADFTLDGRSMRNVRQMTRRVRRQGYVADIRRLSDIPPAEVAWLNGQADGWRGSPTERGFSMALGRVGGPDDGRCVLATARLDGELRALLHFVPWGSDGLSLDLMRRDRAATPGLNDFMIVEVIKNAPALGVKRISLNFAMFRAALERGERIGAGPVLRVWRKILLFLSRWFQIESLYKFNAKFSPQWIPRFMIFPGTSDAPRIGLAALEAEAFVVWPTFELRRLARRLWLGGLRRRVLAVSGLRRRCPGGANVPRSS